MAKKQGNKSEKKTKRVEKVKLEEIPGEKQERYITISENSTTWGGFSNLYEVFGFIDLKVNPDALKQVVLEETQKKAAGK